MAFSLKRLLSIEVISTHHAIMDIPTHVLLIPSMYSMLIMVAQVRAHGDCRDGCGAGRDGGDDACRDGSPNVLITVA